MLSCVNPHVNIIKADNLSDIILSRVTPVKKALPVPHIPAPATETHVDFSSNSNTQNTMVRVQLAFILYVHKYVDTLTI